MTSTTRSNGSVHERPRSLPVNEWPEADQHVWAEACRPGTRLKPGGSASYLAPVSQHDFANRYGAFLGFLQRNGRLNHDLAPAAQVTPPSVEAYMAELVTRVRSATTYNCIYKLLLAHRDREGSGAGNRAALEIPPTRVHASPRPSGIDVGNRGAGVRQKRSLARARRAQWPYDCAPCPWSEPSEEFCSSGDRTDLQTG